MGPCSMFGYFSNLGPLEVEARGKFPPPAPPPLGGPDVIAHKRNAEYDSFTATYNIIGEEDV